MRSSSIDLLEAKGHTAGVYTSGRFIAAIVAESLAAAQDPAPDHPTAPILESAGAPPLADVAWLCDGRMYGSKGEHASWDVLVSSRDWTDLRDVPLRKGFTASSWS